MKHDWHDFMILEITWPLKFVLMRKVAPAVVPLHPAADPRDHSFGVASDAESLPSEYSVIGWLLRPPAVGQQVHVLRVARNGVVVPGCFVSTEVTAVPGEGEFHTLNSVYRWEEIGFLPEPHADHHPR